MGFWAMMASFLVGVGFILYAFKQEHGRAIKWVLLLIGILGLILGIVLALE